MKKILMALFVVGSLAACSQTSQSDTIATMETAYTTAATGAYEYMSGVYGTPNPDVVAQIKKYDAIIYPDLKDLSAAVQSGGTVDTVEEAAAKAALTSLEDLLKTNNVTLGE